MATLAIPNPGKRQAGRPSPLACRECRRKHLKCDASQPKCSRCTKNSLDCIYLPSRRGYQSPTSRKRKMAQESPYEQLLMTPEDSTTLSASISPPPSPDIRVSSQAMRVAIPVSGYTLTDVSGPGLSILPSNPSQLLPGLSSVSLTATEPAFRDDKHLLNLFYSHIYPMHPFLVPQGCFSLQDYPMYLKLVVQLAGSHFASSNASDGLINSVDAHLATVSESSVALVQSLLLFGILLHARLETTKATTTLARACEMAISLGMNRAEFAIEYGMNDAVKEESLRRTWWELYVVDGYLAGLHRRSAFRCNIVELSASLPCSDHLYVEGMTRSLGVTLHQFDQRFFFNEDDKFGSACYRIAAIRILARAIDIMGSSPEDQVAIQSIDNALRAWKFHLPAEKTEFFDEFGTVDHMIIQAHSFISFTYILIHFPKTNLALNLPSMAGLACVPRLDRTSHISNQHNVKAVSACKDISSLAALPIDDHSPLFICCIVFGCIVELSVCSVHSQDRDLHHRERVALMTGLLKQMSRFWPLARDVRCHLNRIASLVFEPPDISELSSVHLDSDSAVNLNTIPDTMAWLDQLLAGEFNMSGETLSG
ncbi:hypothetical protein AA313_de0201104 [Arthrobotrys entomopaga]|nr:hypothetical protein AA313_de0201104 [Arthrobotrys entomopaga]